MIFRDITDRYSKLESFLYDRWVAPAVTSQAAVLETELDAAPQGARVLDVGCGGGQNLLWIAGRRPDLDLTGLDLSADQVGRAERRARSVDVNARFVEGSALELPFEDASFDIVLSVGSLKHWPDKDRGISECLRVLRPGGQLFVVEADRGCRLEDVQRMAESLAAPGPIKRLFVPVYRTWVAGPSLDVTEARALVARAAASTFRVTALPDVPAWLARATK
jgi:ubiquinone/menaquinone biosynthesis C-methylase UbiE